MDSKDWQTSNQRHILNFERIWDTLTFEKIWNILVQFLLLIQDLIFKLLRKLSWY